MRILAAGVAGRSIRQAHPPGPSARPIRQAHPPGPSDWLARPLEIPLTRVNRPLRESVKRWIRFHRPIPPLMKRPFDERALGQIPAGYHRRGPGFVGIGMGKAGTSWWYRLLTDHPQVVPNRLRTKELCYFYHFGTQGLDEAAKATYRRAFAAPAGRLAGEWSPAYLTYPFALSYLAETVPDTKLLVLLRNPVDRALSELNHQQLQRPRLLGLRGERARFYFKYNIFQLVLSHNRLAERLRTLLQYFDRDQLLLLQYEACARDPAREIRRTYRFLGLDDQHEPARLRQPVNTNPYVIPLPTPSQRARLREHFAPDVSALASLVPELDLALWPDFTPHR